MVNRYLTKISTILTAENYNKAFREIYRDFENKIFLKINNKDPVRESLLDFALSGCMPKPTYFVGAVYYMRVELTLEHIQDLRDTIFSQLYPVIKINTPDNLELMLRCILEKLAKQILLMDVITFEDLKDIDFRNVLLASSQYMKASRQQDGNIESILKALPEARDKFMWEYESYVNNLIKSRSAIWKLKNLDQQEYERELQTEFVLSSVTIKPDR